MNEIKQVRCSACRSIFSRSLVKWVIISRKQSITNPLDDFTIQEAYCKNCYKILKVKYYDIK